MSYPFFLSVVAGYFLTSIVLMASKLKHKSRKRRPLPKNSRRRRKQMIKPLFLAILSDMVASGKACRRLLRESCRRLLRDSCGCWLQNCLVPVFKRLSTVMHLKYYYHYGIDSSIQQHHAEQPDSESVSKELEFRTEDVSKKVESSSSELHSDGKNISKEDPEAPEDDEDVAYSEDSSEELVPCDAELIEKRECPDIGAVENLKDMMNKVVVNMSYTEGSFEDDVIISSDTTTLSSSDVSTLSTSNPSVEAGIETREPGPKSLGSGLEYSVKLEQCNTEAATPGNASNLWTKRIKDVLLITIVGVIFHLFRYHVMKLKPTGTDEEDNMAAFHGNGHNLKRKSRGNRKLSRCSARMMVKSVGLILMFTSGSCLAQEYMPGITVAPHLVNVGDRVFAECRFGGECIDCHMDWSINGTVVSPSDPLYPAEFLPEYSSTGHLVFTARHYHNNSELRCILSVPTSNSTVLKYISTPAIIQLEDNVGAPIDDAWPSNDTISRPITDDSNSPVDSYNENREPGSGFSGHSLNSNSNEKEQSDLDAGVSVNASDWWTSGRIAGVSLGLILGFPLIVLASVSVGVLMWLYWCHCKKSKKSLQDSAAEVNGNGSNTEQSSHSRRPFRICSTRLKATSVVHILMSAFHTASSHGCNVTAPIKPLPWSRFSGSMLNCSDGMDQYDMDDGVSVITGEWGTSGRVTGVSLVLGVCIPVMFMVSFMAGVLVWLCWRHHMKQTSEETEWTSVEGVYGDKKNPEEETTGPVQVEYTAASHEMIIAQETCNDSSDEYRKFLVPQPRTALIVADLPAKQKADTVHCAGRRSSAVDHQQESSQMSTATIVALNFLYPLPRPQTATTNAKLLTMQKVDAPPRRPQIPLEPMLESEGSTGPVSKSFEMSHRLSETNAIRLFIACSANETA